jgi:hypothetical protein
MAPPLHAVSGRHKLGLAACERLLIDMDCMSLNQ